MVYGKFFRHFPHTVPEKEIQVVGNPASLALVYKECFICTHISAILHHRPDMALYFLPAHGCNQVFLCRCAIARTHTGFIKPYGNRIFPEIKTFSRCPVLLFQKLRHFFRCLSLLVLGIDTLPAVIPSATTSKNGVKLLLRQRKSSGHGVFYTCLRCCDSADLFLKTWEKT